MPTTCSRDAQSPPVLVADEPDPGQARRLADPRLFRARSRAETSSQRLASSAAARREVEQLGEADWVTMSQAGLQPIRAGRFFVHTPMHYAARPGHGSISRSTPAWPSAPASMRRPPAASTRSTGSSSDGERFANIADIGTGTGLLAFAALALWPEAKCIATDIDPVAIDVARDNAAINGVKLGHGAGELLLAVADGMDSPLLAARAPFDLIIANILAGPLIELAPDFAKALAPGGTIDPRRPARHAGRRGRRAPIER